MPTQECPEANRQFSACRVYETSSRFCTGSLRLIAVSESSCEQKPTLIRSPSGVDSYTSDYVPEEITSTSTAGKF